MSTSIAFVGWLGFKTADGFSTTIKKIYDGPVLGLESLAEISIDAQRTRAILGFIVFADSQENAQKHIGRIFEIENELQASYLKYEATITHDDDRQSFEKLKSIRDRFNSVKNHIVQLVKEEKYREAKAVYSSAEDIGIEYVEQCDVLLHYNKQLAHDYKESVKKETDRMLEIMKMSIPPMVFVVFIAILAINEIFRRLKFQNQALMGANELLEQNRNELKRVNLSLMNQARELEETNCELEAGKEELHSLLCEQEMLVAKETEKRLASERVMAQQAKLASLGEALGNVAHHWRQPLNALAIDIQDVYVAYEAGEINEEYIRGFKTSAMGVITNMSKMIDSFRDFFKPESQKESFDIKDVLKRALTIVGTALESNKIAYSMTSPEHDLIVFGYKNELTQVVVNIISNAKESLSRYNIDNKQLEIKIDSDENFATIAISDNGEGVPEPIIDKIFEPYFTTKHKAQGVGLGLYTSKVVVEQNMKGFITCKNLEHGVCFTISLPLGG